MARGGPLAGPEPREGRLSATRVLLVANTLPPRDLSGVGEQVLQLAAGLRREGLEVQVLGRGPGGVAGPKVLFPLTVLPALWRVLATFRPHVVQVHESDGALAALWLRTFRRRHTSRLETTCDAAPDAARVGTAGHAPSAGTAGHPDVASNADRAGRALRRWRPGRSPRPTVVALLQVSYREERRAVRPLRCSGRVLGRPGGVERRFRRFKAPLQIALGWLTAHAAERLLAPSEATAAELRRDYGVSRVAVVPNVTGGLPIAHRGAAAGEEAGQEEPGYLLFVGRLRIRKGVEVLLGALAHPREGMSEGLKAARLLIAGEGEHRAALERTAAALSLGGQVTFLGRASAAQVRGLLRGARALVVPSIYEGMPLVVLEAMEAAVPVVASRVSGIPEVVVAGETGWLVPPEDCRALAEALAEVLARPEEARRRGLAGRRRLDLLFRPEVAAARWRQAVLEADSQGAAPTSLPGLPGG